MVKFCKCIVHIRRKIYELSYDVIHSRSSQNMMAFLNSYSKLHQHKPRNVMAMDAVQRNNSKKFFEEIQI